MRTIQEHLTLESRIGGYEAAEARIDAVEAAYQNIADLVRTRSENIAFTDSATAAYARALSAIPFKPGDAILTTCNDFASNQIQFLALQSRIGLRVLRAPDNIEGGVDVAAMTELIERHQPKLVCVTHIPTNSGLVQDISAIGSVCRDAGVLYLVDACQSVGQMPVDVHEIKCDFLSATSRKYLRGPRGVGFLFVSDRVLHGGLEPQFLDLRGAKWIEQDEYRAVQDAKRFENWEFAWALVLGTGVAASYATGIGLNKIKDRVQVLATRLRNALSALECVRVLDRGAELCGIVSVHIEGHAPADMVTALRARRINTYAHDRAHAVIDCDRKGVAASLRLSPHYYNTEEEIDRTVAAVRELLSCA